MEYRSIRTLLELTRSPTTSWPSFRFPTQIRHLVIWFFSPTRSRGEAASSPTLLWQRSADCPSGVTNPGGERPGPVGRHGWVHDPQNSTRNERGSLLYTPRNASLRNARMQRGGSGTSGVPGKLAYCAFLSFRDAGLPGANVWQGEESKCTQPRRSEFRPR